MQAAAGGLWLAACRGVAGARDSYVVGAVGAFTAAVGTAYLAASADGVLECWQGAQPLPPWDACLA